MDTNAACKNDANVGFVGLIPNRRNALLRVGEEGRPNTPEDCSTRLDD